MVKYPFCLVFKIIISWPEVGRWSWCWWSAAKANLTDTWPFAAPDQPQSPSLSHVIRGRSRSPGQSRVASNINIKMHIYIYIRIIYPDPFLIISLADSYSLILSTYTHTIIYTSRHVIYIYTYIIYTYNHIHKLYTQSATQLLWTPKIPQFHHRTSTTGPCRMRRPRLRSKHDQRWACRGVEDVEVSWRNGGVGSFETENGSKLNKHELLILIG